METKIQGMIMKSRILWMFIFLLSPCVLEGQSRNLSELPTGSISGTVLIEETEKPIYGANVLIKGTILGSATDKEGKFRISQIQPNMYTLRITAIGYTSLEKTIRIEPEKNTHITLHLKETVLIMDGVAVTASRFQQSIEDLPVSMSLIPAQDIKTRNITSADQALKYVSGVNSMEGGQITIRGSSGFNMGMGSRVLVLYNGNPIMGADNWNINWYSIPTSNIKQIEVMKGSGSALYGSSAMGGVINIISREPDEGNHISIRSFTGFYNKPSYSQWRWTDKQNHFEGTSVDISTNLGPADAWISTSYQSNTGYRENDDHKIFNLMSNISYTFSDNLRLDLMSGYSNNNGGYTIYWKGIDQPYRIGSDPYGYHTRSDLKNTYVFPSLTLVLNNRIYLKLKGKYNHSRTEDHLRATSSDVPEIPSAFRSSEANSQGLDIQLNFQESSRGIVTAGCDLNRDEVKSIQYGHREATRASYFFQYERRLWDRFTVSAGARWDGEEIPDYGSAGELSRKLGMNLKLGKGTNFRFHIGEGFRTPAIGERFVSTFTGGLRISPNPDLLPEQSWSIEAGLKKNLTKSMQIDLSLFHTDYENLIEPQLDTDSDNTVVIRFKNVIKARVRGLDISHRTDWWSNLITTQIGYTLIDSEDKSPDVSPGTPLKYRSRHTLYITNTVSWRPFIFGFDFRYLSQIERIDTYHKVYIPDVDQLVPTYVASLRLGISREHFSMQVIVNNLFQYNYLVSPANIAPPRTATVQLNINY
jgi:iron complex outermembrane receptor protein